LWNVWLLFSNILLLIGIYFTIKTVRYDCLLFHILYGRNIIGTLNNKSLRNIIVTVQSSTFNGLNWNKW